MTLEKIPAITSEASVTSKNISKVFVLRVAQYPFLLAYLVLVPRLMGPQVYGQYALLMSIVAIVAPLVGLALGEIYGRFVPELMREGKSSLVTRFSSNSLALKALIDLISAVVLVGFLHFAYRDRFSDYYFLVVAAIVVVSDLGGVPYTLVFGLNQMGRYALRDPLRRALNLVFILVLFHFYGLPGAILSALFVEGTLGILYFSQTRSFFRLDHFRIDWVFLRPYLRFGFMFYISWSLLNIWQRLGNALIETLTHDSGQVALFDIPNQFYSISTGFILGVVVSLVPMFTSLLLSDKEDKLIKWSSSIIRYLAILCTTALGAFALLGPHLIPILVGSAYASVFPNSLVLLLGMFPMILAEMGYVFSIVYKEPRKYFYGLCIAFAAFLIASILMIPSYASLGAAIATLLSACVLAGVMLLFFRQKMLAGLVESLKGIGLGLVFLPFILFSTRGGFFLDLLLLIAGGFVYALLLFLFRILQVPEIREIWKAIRNRPG